MGADPNFLRELVSGQNPNLDIVAVHGLNPTNKELHAELTWTEGGKLWLRDFLPKRLPNARVLLFGYNSNVAFETSTAGVREQAANLLNRLDFMRRDSPGRPIIFVAHSLGGIIVKRALVEAKLNDKYSTIREATFGIAFFGTPHQGGNQATLGDIAAKIARAVLISPGNTFMEHLKKDSLFSENLTNDFKHQYEDYHILSFYETKFFKSTAGLIVDKNSAILGLSGKRETVVGLNADHSRICKFEEFSDIYHQVEDNIADLAEKAVNDSSHRSALMQLQPQVKGSTFLIPYIENPCFVNRKLVFDNIVESFSVQKGSRSRVALFGLGGVGKTQIAIKYAYWIHEREPDISVYWIHASNIERFHHSFLELAKELQIPESDSPKVDILALVKRWLERKESGKWLMIIDNADDSDMFIDLKSKTNMRQTRKAIDYIPDCTHGSILVTTRNKKVAVQILKSTIANSMIDIKSMNDLESAELVRKVLAGEEYRTEDVLKLTEALEHLPLAISQAAAFIMENSISIPIYLKRYMENKESAVELLSHDFEAFGRDGETHNAVTTTWMLSFKQIKEQNQYAADLLSLMAFLDRHCVPEELLLQHHKQKSSTDFDKATGMLKAFSLVEENLMKIAGVDSRVFSMHRMVQLVTRQWLVHYEESNPWADHALAAVSQVFPPGERENWDRCEVYLPHVQMVLDSNDGSPIGTIFKADLLHNASSYFRVKGYHGRAEKMGLEAINMRRDSLGNHHPDTALSLTGLSRVRLEQGRLADAIELQKLAVACTELECTNSDPNSTPAMHHILASLHATRHLGAIYGIQGQYGEAEKLVLGVVEKSKKLLGEENPDTLLAMRDLAVTYGCQGRPDEAALLHERVLEVRKRILGEDHPETLISMCDLAVTYCQQDPVKNAVKAERLESYVVDARKRILGEEHPNTLDAMRDLAMTYELQSRNAEAAAMRNQVIEARQRGDQIRPATFRAMSNEITTYKQQSLEQVARSLMEADSDIKTPDLEIKVSSPSGESPTESSPVRRNLSVSKSTPQVERLDPQSDESRLGRDEKRTGRGERRSGSSWRRLLSRDRRGGKD